MLRYLLAGMTILFCVFPAGCAGPRQAGAKDGIQTSLTLARDGKPACTIVIASEPTPSARLAALELQSHILKITGAEIPIKTEDEPVTGSRVLVGESAATRALGLDSLGFEPQEYLIAFRPETVILLGRDWRDTPANRAELGRPMSCGETLAETWQRIDYWKTVGMPERSTGEMELPGVYDEQATCYAAYHFLEKCCGVRWYGPSQTGIIVPSQKTLTATGSDIRRSPALKYRDALWAGNWPFMQGQWGGVSRPEVYLYWRRLRLGGEKWAGNHTFHPKTIKTRFTDPAYQAQGKGRGSQLCYSNPKLVAEVAQMARDFFDGKAAPPEGWKAVGDYFAIVPDDNSHFCTCPKCKELLRSGFKMRTGQFSSGTVSNYFFSFVNAVAREVGTTHPDKFIATLAYWNYALPPQGFHLEPNVSIAPCLHTCMYAMHKEMRDNDMKLYKDWLHGSKAPVYLWNYYHHPMEPAVIDKFKCFPNIMVHTSAETARMFIRDGIRGVFFCGEQDMLESYVLAKIYDDPSLDLDGMLDEFFDLYFGGAAEPMKEFYLGLERVATDPKNYPEPFYRKNGIDWKNVAWSTLGTAARMEHWKGLMDRAQSLAATDEEKARVALWRDALWKWMEDGWAARLEGTADRQVSKQ